MPASSSSSSSSGSSSSTTTTASSTTSDDSDDSDDSASSDDPEDYTIGKLVRDDSLPYPYQFPEPNKAPVAGGRMQVAATYRVQNFDPTRPPRAGPSRSPTTSTTGCWA